MNKSKGITLIALIITVVVLLILAITSINAIANKEILKYAKDSTEQYNKENAREKVQLALNKWRIEKIINNKPLKEFLIEEFEVENVLGDMSPFTVIVDGYEIIVDINGKIYEGSMALEQAKTIYDLEINNNDGTYAITSLKDKSTSGKIVIPSLIDGKKVSSVNYRAFFGASQLTDVLLPDSTTSIGVGAFQGCVSLKTINIPNGVTSIENWSFKGCTNLTSIIIPDSVTSIGACAFKECTKLTTINIPSRVTTIGNYALQYTNLSTIDIPASVTSIGINIVKNVKEIKVDENNTNYCSVDGVLFNKDITNLIQYPINKEATSYIMPNSVTNVSYGAFAGNVNLASIKLLDNLQSMEAWAFSVCKNLTQIIIPNSIKTIDTTAFNLCTSLVKMVIDKYESEQLSGAPWGAPNTNLEIIWKT